MALALSLLLCGLWTPSWPVFLLCLGFPHCNEVVKTPTGVLEHHEALV